MLVEELICKEPLGFITAGHRHHWNRGTLWNLKWVSDLKEGEQGSTYWILGKMASYECLKMNCNRWCNCKAMEGGSYHNLPWICCNWLKRTSFLKQLLLEVSNSELFFPSSPFLKTKALTLRYVEVFPRPVDCHSHASHSDSCCLHKKRWPHGSGSSAGITVAHTWFLYLYYKAQKHSARAWLLQLVESSLHGSNDLHWQGGAGHWEHCPPCLFDLYHLYESQWWGLLDVVLQLAFLKHASKI